MLAERAFASAGLAAAALADNLSATLRDAIEERGRAILAVSGGRTPRLVFERLRQARLDWSRVTVTLTDERWVPPDHLESNERLVRSTLLRGHARRASFVPLYGGEAMPEAGLAACEARLRALPLPFDAVYLGTAPDGHIASLFPDDAVADAAEGLCVPVPASRERLARMSLTWPALLSTRRIQLFFTGAAKAMAYVRARRAGPGSGMPLGRLLAHEGAPITVLSSP